MEDLIVEMGENQEQQNFSQQQGNTQSGQVSYGQPGQAAYGQPGQAAYGQPGQAAYGQPGQAPYGQPGQAAYGQPGQAPYGQPGQAPYGQPGQAPYGQPGHAPYGQPPRPAQNTAQKSSGAGLGNLLNDILSIIKTPAEGAKKFVRDGELVSAAVLIGADALLAFIFTLVGTLIFGMSVGPAFGKAFYMLFYVVLSQALVATATFVAGGTIFKGGMTFIKGLNVAAIYSLFQAVAIVLGIIISIFAGLLRRADFISGVVSGIAFIIFAAVWAAGLVVAIYGLCQNLELDENKKIFAVLMAIIMVILLVTIIDNLFEKVLPNGTNALQIFGYFSMARYYFGWL
jgi:hypothetical protein